MQLLVALNALLVSKALVLQVGAQPIAAVVHDARITPAKIRAPLVTNPSELPDFALFRECEGCPEMVILPAGSFKMGSPADEPGRADNEDSQAGAGGAQVQVSVGRFAIARFETTWEEWEVCVAAEVCRQRPDSGFGRGRRPVINVDWQTDTQAFIRFVNGRASAYRLPSEAEWEYAARGRTSTAYPWGPDAQHDHSNYGADQCCIGLALGVDRWEDTAPVGQFPANAFGLHDMVGNVREWAEDCYQDNLARRTAAAYVGGACTTRMVRGGDLYSYPVVLRTAYRIARYPSDVSPSHGFRLARTL
jgi:formylglycine-generating enzyme required for sulfatase activity